MVVLIRSKEIVFWIQTKAPILLYKAEFLCWKKLLARMNTTTMRLS